VSHGSLIRLVLAVFVLGAPPGRHRRLWLENGRFALVEWGTHPRLLAFNAVRLD
jgi:broad specificity phosphatase PhoE